MVVITYLWLESSLRFFSYVYGHGAYFCKLFIFVAVFDDSIFINLFIKGISIFVIVLSILKFLLCPISSISLLRLPIFLLFFNMLLFTHWNISMITLKSISNNLNIFHLDVGICWLSFLIKFELFLVLGISDVWLKAGPLGFYVERMWIFIWMLGFCWLSQIWCASSLPDSGVVLPFFFLDNKGEGIFVILSLHEWQWRASKAGLRRPPAPRNPWWCSLCKPSAMLQVRSAIS